jgi:hypothetical protein
MSTDHLLRSLEQNAHTIVSLRQHPPLFATLVSLEGPCADPFESITNGLLYFARTSGLEIRFVSPPAPSFTGGGHYGKAVYTARVVEKPQGATAFQAFEVLAHRMAAILNDLPETLLRRLGIESPAGAPWGDWLWVLFHLAWHFPEVFSRGAVRRNRCLIADIGVFCTPEYWLQLYECCFTQDRFSGLIYSHFPQAVDLVTATAWAVDLLRSALSGGVKPELTPSIRQQFGELHQAFSTIGQHSIPGHDAGPLAEFEAKVLRLDSSFATRPASDWAGVERPAGTRQDIYFLSRKGAVKECCVLRGPGVAQFAEMADRAGKLLPEWPANPDPVLVENAQFWDSRVKRRQEILAQTWEFVTDDGSAPNGKSIPTDQVAERVWSSMRPTTWMQGLVTDHRGNVERWLGFVFYTIKEFQPDSVEIRTIPEGPPRTSHAWNAVLTLRDMNLFQASARAMELAGWIRGESISQLPPSKSTKRSTTSGEAREKIIAGLAKHHKYAAGSCMNFEPIKVNKFAKELTVSLPQFRCSSKRNSKDL